MNKYSETAGLFLITLIWIWGVQMYATIASGTLPNLFIISLTKTTIILKIIETLLQLSILIYSLIPLANGWDSLIYNSDKEEE